MSQKFPLTLKYQQPGQIAPAEVMTVVDNDQLDRITKVIAGQEEDESPNHAPLPPKVIELQTLFRALTDAVCLAERQNGGNPTPRVSTCAKIPLSALRAFGSSPKQMAFLLGCNCGYFPEEGEDPLIYLSASRFAPTAGFYDLLQEGQ